MDSPAQDEKFLPKEPLDLPRPHDTLPPPHDESSLENVHDVHTLLSWHAPGRPFRVRSKAYYINMLLILLPLEVIFLLFGQYMLMLVGIALAFFYFALTTVPPHDFRYKLSTEGIMIEDYFFLWQELYDFYFKQIDGNDCIIIRTKAYLPGELTISLGEMHKEQVKMILLPYLPFREFVRPTLLEKWGEKLRKMIPLEHSPHMNRGN